MADEIDLWKLSVDGADVLDAVECLLHGYVYATEENRDAIALWVAFTHVFECFGVSPILDIFSPTK